LSATDHALDNDQRDAAGLLYQNGVGVPFLTCVAGAFMIVAMPSARAASGWTMVAWLAAMVLVAGVRAWDILGFQRRRLRSDWTGRTELARFGAGTLATALIWAAFPLLFFRELNGLERTTMAITLCAISGGSVAILGAVPWLVIAFAACMLLPGAAMFLLTPGGENTVLGIGGILFFLFVSAESAVIQRGTTSAIRMSRANQRLNDELTRAQAALNESLETLEDRILARTAELEREVMERDRYGRELARFALRDSLTGLYNRHTLADQLASELKLAESAGEAVAVLFVDLDKFKEVNDLLGHHAGDEVLRSVVNRMSVLVPPEAILARWGGDEFVFAQRLSATQPDAIEIGEQLRRAVVEPVVVHGESVRVGATIGVAIYPDHGSTADELIRAADIAMYAAKEEGRGRVRTYEPALAVEIGKRQHLEHALRDAIANGELRLEYQPIVDGATQRCTSFEALLRWDSQIYGSVSPGEFIPIAERSGEINAIGHWVLERACCDAATWPGSPGPPVSVNLSVAQIVAGTVLDDVRNAIAISGLDPRRLHLEVTESLFAGDHAETLPTLEALRAMGVSISLDDFGTGFSSLGYLRSLPIDVIKIDKTFIDHIEGESHAIVEAIHQLARSFNLTIIAEGVENERQADLLRAMGVSSLQGYYFSRSMHPGMVEAAINSNRA
jgi:diguanylate cyclase (GGDEF)-like protein